jgi:hypothetical protein
LTVDAATEPSPGQSYSYIASISRDLATDADEFLLNWAAGANPAIAALRFTNSEATPIVIEASLNDRQ